MPSFAIHISVANEYMRKHVNEIKDVDGFILGTIEPDLVKDKKDKSVTHYGPVSSQVHLRKYLESNEINSDFDKGYFLHLITDYIFYNKIIDIEAKDIYNDYDVLNKYLVEKYKVLVAERRF